MPLPASAVPAEPAENEICNATFESAQTLALMARRRSTKVVHLQAPGPSGEALDAIIRLAARTPDHGKLGPWRFVVIEGDARTRAGEALAGVVEGDDDARAKTRETFLRAPVCVMVVSTAGPHPKIPEWEQILSAGAVCHGLLIAAHAMGYGGCWLTGWPCYNARARAALGLNEAERIAGFIHLGAPTEAPTERSRPDWAGRTTRF